MSGVAPGLWRHRDFLRLWTGQSISRLGSQVSLIAIPFTAVVVLHVDAFRAGLLGAVEYLPFLVVGLPAGAIVDRLRRRRVLVVADLGRFAVLGSIPVAWWLGDLTLLQLYIVAALAGVLTVFFDVAYQSYLPALVAPTQLVEGNAKLEVSSSSAQLAGPTVGGALIALVGAPVAVVADSLSYLWSVAFLLAIRVGEPPPAPRSEGALLRRMRRDVAEGLGYVLGHRLIRPIALCTATSNLFGNMGLVLLVLFAVRDLGLSATAVGLAYSLGGVGFVAGALLARPVSVRLGIGTTILVTALLFPLDGLLCAMAPRGSGGVLVIGLAGLLGGGASVVYNVAQVSLRQAITPLRLQGRLNATMRFIVWGTIPVGALLGGVLGGIIGLRATILVAGLGSLLAALPVALSPVRHLRSIEEAMPVEMLPPLASTDELATSPGVAAAPGTTVSQGVATAEG